MSLKEDYYKLSKKDFDAQLDEIKNSKDTIHFFVSSKHPYFYKQTPEINKKILMLNKAQWEFDSLMESFSSFGQKQIVQSFLLDEIEATNKIESIFSTRHDIFSVLAKAKESKDKKIISIVNYYSLLLERSSDPVSSLGDVRAIYDKLLSGAIEKEDLPDGEFFRKGPVYVTDGVKNVHSGLVGEENINEAMSELLSFYQSDYEVYERMIISHFLLETIHPYYDGNGRLGRFLFSNGLYLENGTYFSFLIARSFSNNKAKYYKALKEARDIREFGCLNDFVLRMIDVFISEITLSIEKLKEKKEKVDSISTEGFKTKSEKKIYALLKEGSILSDFGLSNEEIKKETNVSKRTLVYVMNSFKEKKLLKVTKIGKYSYWKLKGC